jgi:hypothetical protein
MKPKFASNAARLRRLWYKQPRSKIPTIERPFALLTTADAAENYKFRLADSEHGRDDPLELIDRVRLGLKPMATIVLRAGRRVYLGEPTLRKAVEAMGLCYKTVHVYDANRVDGVVFQPGLTLGNFYPAEETASRYQAAGVALPSGLFSMPLESFADSLAKENFTDNIKLPLTGMCFGYPVPTTLELLAQP